LSFLRSLACLTVCTGLICAETNVPVQPAAAANLQTSSWLSVLWDLPLIRIFKPFLTTFQSLEGPAAPEVSIPDAELPPCTVAAIPAITDPDALEFESKKGSDAVVDTGNMNRAAAKALTKLQGLVGKAGGSVDLKSAYRPPAYQAHLQAVWDRWSELRDNDQPQCQDLKAQVQQEFTEHHLLLTQRPANSSDHTRGLAFDALVSLPQQARLAKRRVTLDYLARLSGVRRVDILHDPVHFKFIGFRTSRRG
jgi:hypothetical protein